MDLIIVEQPKYHPSCIETVAVYAPVEEPDIVKSYPIAVVAVEPELKEACVAMRLTVSEARLLAQSLIDAAKEADTKTGAVAGQGS